ncbi:MAG: hypothetical protein KKF93_03880, partial [Candidatus Omnitrophica bacterium]|nr:hypothetical protein [Candidatus Omnitrophota bacterium]
QNNATREDIQKQILNITAILKEKLDKKELASIDVLHLAESIRYAPADHAEYVKELLTESFVEPPREENQEKGPKMKQFPPAADRKVFVLGQQNNLSPFIERAI